MFDHTPYQWGSEHHSRVLESAWKTADRWKSRYNTALDRVAELERQLEDLNKSI